MGTIASVLQWTCHNCNLINPTENLRCLNCGNVRRIRFDRLATIEQDDYGSTDSLDDGSLTTRRKDDDAADAAGCVGDDDGSGTSSMVATTTNSHEQHQQQQQQCATNDRQLNGHQPDQSINATPTTAVADGCARAETKGLKSCLRKPTLPGYVEINSNG